MSLDINIELDLYIKERYINKAFHSIFETFGTPYGNKICRQADKTMTISI